jgi:hypothetical protein
MYWFSDNGKILGHDMQVAKMKIEMAAGNNLRGSTQDKGARMGMD